MFLKAKKMTTILKGFSTITTIMSNAIEKKHSAIVSLPSLIPRDTINSTVGLMPSSLGVSVRQAETRQK